MKHIKKLLALLLMLATLLAALPMAALAADTDVALAETAAVEIAAPALRSAPATSKSGKWGNVSWAVSGTKLTISGSGAMPQSSSYTDAPWSEFNDSIRTVEIKSGVTTIADEAFFCFRAMTSISIPNTVTKIGQGAFYACDSLTKITIPASVTSIGEQAFTSCASLTSFSVDSNNKNFCSPGGVLFNKAKTKLIAYPTGKKGAYTIPSGVTELDFVSFAYCTGLTSVTIPNTVKLIGTCAFEGCSGLTSVTIPSSVQTIYNSAFSECAHLTKYTIESKTVNIYGTALGYAYNSTAKKTQVVSGLVIYGYNGSTAQTYAKENSITFKTIGSGQSTKLATPKITKLEGASGGVIITWGAVSGAAKYRVFRRVGSGSWERVADVTTTRAVDRNAKTGTTYTYTVRCMDSNNKYVSDFDSNGMSIRYGAGQVTTPKVTKLESASGGIIINWGAVSGAAKYRVFRKVGNGNWERVADVTTNRAVDRNVSSGTTYTYTVRCMDSNNKYISDFNTSGWSIKR